MQALYKSWFIDFKPFGNTMPCNWKTGKLKEVLKLKRQSLKAEDNTELPYLPIDVIPMRTFALTGFKPNSEAQSSLITFDKDDIIIGAMRVYFHRVVLAPCDGITRTTCFTLVPHHKEYLSFALLCCDQDSSIDYAQSERLQEVLQYTLVRYEVTENKQQEKISEQNFVELFLSAKRIEGCSEKSLKYYKATIEAMLNELQKDVKHIVTDDIRRYLTEYQEKKKSSKVTIDNIRRILSSFFSWLEDEDYILKSPVRRIHKVKTGTNIKETYSDEALELMRDNCTQPRDLAIIDMLASTGMRVGEMVLLNRNDIDFNERECIVFGKGSKERVVYFDARTKIHLQNYLGSRTDDNPALFVSLKSPHERLKIGGVEVRLREFGKKLGLQKVHPHKFRRTLATMAIDKGMPIEQLQQLLGHRKIDTTLQYAMVKQSNVKIAHRKYIG